MVKNDDWPKPTLSVWSGKKYKVCCLPKVQAAEIVASELAARREDNPFVATTSEAYEHAINRVRSYKPHKFRKPPLARQRLFTRSPIRTRKGKKNPLGPMGLVDLFVNRASYRLVFTA